MSRVEKVVYCSCCKSKPKGLFGIGPDGITMRHNKGRGQRHIAMLSPLEVLQRLAGSNDPRDIERFVEGVLERIGVSTRDSIT